MAVSRGGSCGRGGLPLRVGQVSRRGLWGPGGSKVGWQSWGGVMQGSGGAAKGGPPPTTIMRYVMQQPNINSYIT